MSGRTSLVIPATISLAAVVAIVIGAAWINDVSYLDGYHIEGVAVSNEGHPCASAEAWCSGVTSVARAALLARQPGARIVGVSFHDMPHERSDGAFMVASMPSYRIVFTLADGSQRVEMFGCGIGGELTEGSPAGFAPYCPQPADP